MLKYVSQETETITPTGIIEMRVSIIIDSSADLVTSDGNIQYTAGSIAWSINDRTVFGLNSTGEWVNQKGAENNG